MVDGKTTGFPVAGSPMGWQTNPLGVSLQPSPPLATPTLPFVRDYVRPQLLWDPVTSRSPSSVLVRFAQPGSAQRTIPVSFGQRTAATSFGATSPTPIPSAGEAGHRGDVIRLADAKRAAQERSTHPIQRLQYSTRAVSADNLRRAIETCRAAAAGDISNPRVVARSAWGIMLSAMSDVVPDARIASYYLNSPLTWAAIVARKLYAIPPGLIERHCFAPTAHIFDSNLRPDERLREVELLWEQSGVPEALAAVVKLGLTTFFDELPIKGIKIAREGEEAAFATELIGAARLVELAARFRHDIDVGWPLAQAQKLNLGAELEFDPSGWTLRDVYEQLLESFKGFEDDHGRHPYAAASLEKGAAYFPVQPDSLPFATQYVTFATSKHRVEVEFLQGTGANLAFVRRFNGNGLCVEMQRVFGRCIDVENGGDRFREIRPEAYRFVADMLRLNPSSREAEEVRQGRGTERVEISTRRLQLIKAGGDIAQMWMTMEPDGQSVRIEAVNCTFEGAWGDEHSPMQKLDNTTLRVRVDTVEGALSTILAHAVDHQQSLKRNSPYKKLLVPGLGAIVLEHEAYPYLEAVTSTMNAGDDSVELFDLLARFLSEMGVRGTTMDRAIGIHTHGEVPIRDTNGRLSVAMIGRLLTTLATREDEFLELIDPTACRRGFIQEMSQEFRRRVLKQNYAKHPDNPLDILAVLTDIVTMMARKYNLMNFHNVLCWLLPLIVKQMVDDGYQLSQSYSRRVADRKYTFELHHDGGDRYWATAEAEGGSGSVNLMAMPWDSRKPTAEARGFDTLEFNGNIDTEAPAFFLQWWGSVLASVYH